MVIPALQIRIKTASVPDWNSGSQRRSVQLVCFSDTIAHSPVPLCGGRMVGVICCSLVERWEGSSFSLELLCDLR